MSTSCTTGQQNSNFSIEGFGVAYGDNIVLASLDVCFSDTGITVVVGPCGSGKSTLLRSLAGLNNAQPNYRCWGNISESFRLAAFVGQHARLLLSSGRENLVSAIPNRSELTPAAQNRLLETYLEVAELSGLSSIWAEPVRNLPLVVQRKLSIISELLRNPPLLLIDEPMAGLDTADAEGVVRYIRRIAAERGVVVVTHNQIYAKELGGRIVLIAGGRVQEQGHVSDFFTTPQTDVGMQFVNTGGCKVPSPGAKPEELADDCPIPPSLPAEALRTTNQHLGPYYFFWARKGRFAGMPRPGIVAELAYDLCALSAVGVSVLVTLEEKVYFDSSELERHKIEHIFLPIVDMEVPTLEQAAELCKKVVGYNKTGRSVTFHCRAGKGRTGTMLACQLIFLGSSAIEAVDDVRAVNPEWIQSEMQLGFLEDFETWLLHY